MIEYDFDYDEFYVPMIEHFNKRKERNEVTQEESSIQVQPEEKLLDQHVSDLDGNMNETWLTVPDKKVEA
jgi:1,2-phenylacetyl-CoA epoxidase catalytic subunit